MKRYCNDEGLLSILASHMHSICHDYALSKLKYSDFILLRDAYPVTKFPNDMITVMKDGKFHTIKNSKADVYRKAYEKRLMKVLSKIK